MSLVAVERIDESIRVLRLNRPERLNALSIDLAVELDQALAELGQDNLVRIVILT
ncbi:MAG: enoyl-CoA hydratase, partial [Actinobacteria bacterium]|nr:enoyl-CoA hydratase [Actinomycetota bacterium]